MALPNDDNPNEKNQKSNEEEDTHDYETSNSNEIQKSKCNCNLSLNQLAAMISNLSTSYNTTNISLALPILHAILQTPEEEKEDRDGLIASSLLGGMAVGQIIGGTLGDVIGRREALILVILLQMVASIGSATVPQKDSTLQYTLIIWRFFLGVGAGGVYPLAAVLSAEDTTSSNSSSSIHHSDKLRQVALTFSTQGVGFLLVPLITYPLLLICTEEHLDVVWRVILGLGALPGVFLFALLLVQSCSSSSCFKCGCCFGKQRNSTNPTSQHSFSQDESSSMASSTMKQSLSTNTTKGEEIFLPTQTPPPQSSFFKLQQYTHHHFHPPTTTLEFGIHEKEHQLHESLMAEEDYSHHDGSISFHTASASTIRAFSIHSSAPTTTSTKGLWQSIKEEPHLMRKLCGTAGTWFLFDILFYGNTLFQPVVLEAAFGRGGDGNREEDEFQLLLQTARDGLILTSIALPGYFVSALVVGRYTSFFGLSRNKPTSTEKKCCTIHQTPRYIQSQGFTFMFLLYTIIGSLWTQLASIQALLLLVYGGTFFFANYGPNATTFMLPSITYSEKCRSTLNGISAAAGKAGALVGTLVFEPAAEKWGDNVVMLICAGLSVLALILTRICIVDDYSRGERVDASSSSHSFSPVGANEEEDEVNEEDGGVMA